MKRLILFVCVIWGIGCGHGHEDHDHDGDHSAGEEACEHMAEESASQATAGATEKEAVDTSKDDWLHRRNEVTLNAEGESFVGYLTLEVGKAGIHQLFADKPVEITIGGVAAASTSPVDECTDVDAGYNYDLPVGEHIMAIRADEAKVSVVIEFPTH